MIALLPLIRPSATFSHAKDAGEGISLMSLRPCEAWEKVPDRADEGLLVPRSKT
jgi:hypothetical protein